MKKLLILFFPVFIFFTCNNNSGDTKTTDTITVEELKPLPVKISGTIENPVSEMVSIRAKDLDKKATVTDGKFVLEFDLTKPTRISFGHGTESGTLYLEPGDEVNLTLNPEQFDETLMLVGEGSEESNYLLAKYLMNEKYQESFREDFALPVDDFLKKMDEQKAANQTHLAEYSTANKNMNPSFVKSEKNSIEYDWASSKLNYPAYFEYFTKTEKPELSADYFSFMDNIDLNNETDYKNNQSYARLISTYLNMEAEKVGKEGIENLSVLFDLADKKLKNNTIQSGFLFEKLSSFLNYNDAKGADVFVEKFNKINTDEKRKTDIAKSYDVAMSLLKGKPAPTFVYHDSAGKEVSLESMKGKNVYVDVWATWCGPCIREIPSLKELEKSYHGNDEMVFMSVSIDKMADKEKWIKMVAEKELEGVQIMADKAWKSSICKDYSINGIPRFILIDKDGNIVDKNAPRPSSKEIKEVLAELTGSDFTSMK